MWEKIKTWFNPVTKAPEASVDLEIVKTIAGKKIKEANKVINTETIKPKRKPKTKV